MVVEISSYAEALEWAQNSGASAAPHLLLGNGFSVAYDHAAFSYGALLDHSQAAGKTSGLANHLFSQLGTYDFERVIQHLSIAADSLEALDKVVYAEEIVKFRDEADLLKETLAAALASLHPSRPYVINDQAYGRVSQFLEDFGRVYTANYDLLLYWVVMHGEDGKARNFSIANDGFRSPPSEEDYVVWNYLSPHDQKIFYLHGALHLYRDAKSAELQKLTWIRTGDALIDQIRSQLNANRFPLIVTEGSSAEKLAKIQTSDYLSKGLRSLASLGGGMIAHGLAFSANDAHIGGALVASKVRRVAVSIFGDPASEGNSSTIQSALRLTSDRIAKGPKFPLEVRFYDAESAPLWK